MFFLKMKKNRENGKHHQPNFSDLKKNFQVKRIYADDFTILKRKRPKITKYLKKK